MENKKFLIAVCAVCMALMCIACGNKSGGDSADNSGGNTSTSSGGSGGSGGGGSGGSGTRAKNGDSNLVGKWVAEADPGTYFIFNANGTYVTGTMGTIFTSTDIGGPDVTCWYTDGDKFGLYPDIATITYSVSGDTFTYDGAVFKKQTP